MLKSFESISFFLITVIPFMGLSFIGIGTVAAFAGLVLPSVPDFVNSHVLAVETTALAIGAAGCYLVALTFNGDN